VPDSDADIFRYWIYRNFQLAPRDNRIREQVTADMRAYFLKLMEEREAEPRDDLATLIVQAEIDGKPIDRELQYGYLLLLILAGIDTTWSAIGSSLWHLAQSPDDVQRMLDDPEVVPFAIEEFLRAYAPVTMARMVAQDVDFHGCPMKQDDWVLLPFPAANRDPKKFEDPDTFIIDREENRHAAFGLGIHRCLGSNLARLELRVAIEEFIKRFPKFELVGETSWSGGQIRGPREMPVRILDVAT